MTHSHPSHSNILINKLKQTHVETLSRNRKLASAENSHHFFSFQDASNCETQHCTNLLPSTCQNTEIIAGLFLFQLKHPQPVSPTFQLPIESDACVLVFTSVTVLLPVLHKHTHREGRHSCAKLTTTCPSMTLPFERSGVKLL